jgi:hypothetical protein
MNVRKLLLCAVLLSVAPISSPSAFAEMNAKAVAQVDELQPAIDEAIRRGTLIYQYDQAAWHSTDAMMAAIKNPEKAGVKGWIVLNAEQGVKVIYYAKDDQGLYAAYSAIWTGAKIIEGTVYALNEREALSPEEVRIANIFQSMPKDGIWTCSKQNANIVTLPREALEGSDSIYILTPQSVLGVYPAGGHNRVDMKDGSFVSRRPFSKGCLDLGGADTAKGDAVAFMVTHMLDPTPTEIHVFTALAANKSIYVATTANGRTWEVNPNGGKPTIKPIEMSAK